MVIFERGLRIVCLCTLFKMLGWDLLGHIVRAHLDRFRSMEVHSEKSCSSLYRVVCFVCYQ